MPLLTILKKNTFFWVPVIITLLIGMFFLASYTKTEIHLEQNSWYSSSADIFFKYITHLGDGVFFALAFIPLMFIKWRYALGLLLSAVLTLLMIGVLKQVVFAGEPRPIEYFKNIAELRLVEGVKMSHWNSFPSGHTTAAFTCFGFLAFIVASNWSKLGFYIIALLTGYSRIYLSQHFLRDVVAGMVLGTLIALFSFWLLQLSKKNWLDNSISRKS